MGAIWTLAVRELVHFSRAKARLIGAVLPPAMFWVLVGAGFGKSSLNLGTTSVGYSEYFFTGTLAMVLMFSAIFSAISLIEDRNEGFLQGVLVSPAPTWSIVLGKILGGTVLSFLQGSLFLVLAPSAGVPLSAAGLLTTLPIMLVSAFALSSLGVMVAWPMTTIQGFHAIMNMVLMPMWLLSGSLFSAAGAHPAVRLAMQVNPLTYSVSALRHSLYLGSSLTVEGPPLQTSLVALCVFAAAALAGAIAVASARRYDG